MADLEQQQQGAKSAEREGVKIENAAKALDENVAKLAKVGGYALIESTVEGAQNLNPERKARKKIFLTEAGQKKDRENLKSVLQLWQATIAEGNSVPDMIERAPALFQLASCIQSFLLVLLR